MSALPHLARTLPFSDLHAGLAAEIDAGTVATTTDGPLVLYKYTDRCAFERAWSPFSLIARGLVLDHDAERVVATPFPKFFNHGEGHAPDTPMAPLPDEPFHVTEKLDGSLVIVFLHDGRWRAVTRGSFRSTQAQWAQNYLERGPGHLWRGSLTPGHTYLFEACYRDNRIVVSYDEDRLVLLGAYDEHGYEYPYERLAAVGTGAVAPAHAYDALEDLLAVATRLGADREGFVVRFASGRRLKIKGDEYCRVHRLVSRVTPLAVWELIVAGDDPGSVRQHLPEEFGRDFDTLYAILSAREHDKRTAVAAAAASVEHLDNKGVGLWLQSPDCPVDREAARWVFPYRKTGLADASIGGSVQRRRFCDSFRPTGNRLDGYTPSSAMNRFTEEAG